MDISHPVDSESPLPRAGADPTKPTPLQPFPTPPLLGKLGQGTDLDVYADEPPTSHIPAMGLTMGLMNAVAAREAGADVNGSNPIQTR